MDRSQGSQSTTTVLLATPKVAKRGIGSTSRATFGTIAVYEQSKTTTTYR